MTRGIAAMSTFVTGRSTAIIYHRDANIAQPDFRIAAPQTKSPTVQFSVSTVSVFFKMIWAVFTNHDHFTCAYVHVLIENHLCCE